MNIYEETSKSINPDTGDILPGTVVTPSILFNHFFDFIYEVGNEYGEPGYHHDGDGPIVSGDWNCPHPGSCTIKEPGKHHGFDAHYPNLAKALEDQEYDLIWGDEWTVTPEGNFYRINGDSYHWQPSIIWTEDGEILTPDDDIEEWIEVIKNNPEKCLPTIVWDIEDIMKAGFEIWEHGFNDTYENGWYPGQTDDPTKIFEEVVSRFSEEDQENLEVIFTLKETSQFYTKFQAWTRMLDTDDDN